MEYLNVLCILEYASQTVVKLKISKFERVNYVVFPVSTELN